MTLPLRQERHELDPYGSTKERIAAALAPESLAKALRTRKGLEAVQTAVRASFVPAVTAPQLEDVQAAVDELLKKLGR